MKLEYNEIKSYFYGYWDSDEKTRNCRSIFNNIEMFVNPNEIRFFYPKNLFVKEKDLEIYIFLNDKIIKGGIVDNNIELNIYNLKNLIGLRCECINYYEEFYHKIVMNFINEDVIILNSIDDSKDTWRYKFEEQIKDIIKELIKFNGNF